MDYLHLLPTDHHGPGEILAKTDITSHINTSNGTDDDLEGIWVDIGEGSLWSEVRTTSAGIGNFGLRK